jgi:hypothetical protein
MIVVQRFRAVQRSPTVPISVISRFTNPSPPQTHRHTNTTHAHRREHTMMLSQPSVASRPWAAASRQHTVAPVGRRPVTALTRRHVRVQATQQEQDKDAAAAAQVCCAQGRLRLWGVQRSVVATCVLVVRKRRHASCEGIGGVAMVCTGNVPRHSNTPHPPHTHTHVAPPAPHTAPRAASSSKPSSSSRRRTCPCGCGARRSARCRQRPGRRSCRGPCTSCAARSWPSQRCVRCEELTHALRSHAPRM